MEFHRIQKAIDLLGAEKPTIPKPADGVTPPPADTKNGEVNTENVAVASDPAAVRPNGEQSSEGSAAKRSPLAPSSALFGAVSGSDSAPVAAATLPGIAEPKLGIGWGEFHPGVGSSAWALLRPPFGRGERGEDGKPVSCPYLRDTRVERRVPVRAVIAAGLWHVAILALPISLFTGLPHKNAVFQNVEITWKGPIEDLPLLQIPREQPKAAPRVEAPKALPAIPAEAFHPRQRIFTDPVRPTHPRQTLINPAAPAIAPKFLPNLPNIVQFQQVNGPAKPRMQITEEMLKKRPREKRVATDTATPAQIAPNMERQIAEMNLAPAQSGPARPKLDINAGAAPHVAERKQAGDAGPAPDVGTQLSAANGGPTPLVALSAKPTPPAPVAPPQGNLAARVSMSPEGKKDGNAGVSNMPAAGDGKNSVAVGISGGSPSASTSGGDPAAKVSAPAPRVLITRPEPKTSGDVEERTSPPDFAALPPGARPEMIFGSRKVYKMNVNMPNLNSSTGSWILNFSEFPSNNRSHMATPDLNGPVAVKKVDPKYPPTLIADKVEGEVILYAVIRRDGSVDSIQLVRGVDKQLDANAMKALAQWQFRPASKQGMPVELEAIVHIPFRLPENY